MRYAQSGAGPSKQWMIRDLRTIKDAEAFVRERRATNAIEV
jgi:hypothetical protein